MKYIIVILLSITFGWLIHMAGIESSELLCAYEIEKSIEKTGDWTYGKTCDGTYTDTIRYFGFTPDLWRCVMVDSLNTPLCCTVRPWFEQMTSLKRDFWDDANERCKNAKPTK